MKAIVSALIVTVFSASVFAAPSKIATENNAGSIPAAVTKAVGQFASEAIKLSITAETGVVCGGEPEKYYIVEIKVRNQLMTENITDPTVYAWETVKTVSVDANGGLMELCRE